MGGVIITIRNKMGYLLIVVISLAILGFLLMDATSSNQNLFRQTSNNVGSVNGQEIEYATFQKKLNKALEDYKLNQGVANIPDDVTNAIRNETWDNFVRDKIMDEQYEALALNVPVDEVYEMLQGTELHPAARQQFTDPSTGLYDRNGVAMYIQNLGTDDANGTSVEKTRRWLGFEQAIIKDRIEQKYSMLIKKAIHTPTWMAEANYSLAYGTVSFEYVLLPFSSVPNDQVTVTDEDLTAYLNAHKGQFQQENRRIIEYVSFPKLPSAQDTADALAYITGQYDKFSTVSDDSVYVKRYSEIDFDPTYSFIDELSPIIADTMFVVDSATMIGPYQEEGMFKVAKLADRKMIPDSVEARHILFAVRTQEELIAKKALADSLLIELQEGRVQFTDLVIRHTDDETTQFDGGNLGFVKPGEQFYTIERALFNDNEEGDFVLVGSNVGFHLIEITTRDPQREAVRVAYLTRSIEASENTTNDLYTQASQYKLDHNTAETFGADKNVKTSNPFSISEYTIVGLGNAREVVQWSYEATLNDISDVIILDNSFVIARLIDVREAGTATIANAREQLEALVINEKKAALLAGKVTSGADPASVAAANGVSTGTAAGVNYTNAAVGTNNEPKVAAAALALEAGAVSKPITGTQGVYVLKLTEKTPATAPAGGYTLYKAQLSRAYKDLVDTRVYAAIKEASEIVDERYKIY